ncbi:MAG TPA: hypothetical protein VFG10_11205 [Saprospiraceae bacterium]|nr:hypothetical protein [Saprospiraceae bacterium]
MKIKHLFLALLILTGIVVPLSPLRAGHQGGYVNLEDVRRGKRELKSDVTDDQSTEIRMDGLSLAAYVTSISGIASLFLLPTLGLLFLPAGFIMGIIAWRSKRRYERRRGRGLALAAVAIGGAFTLATMVSLIAFFVTFGVF